MGGKGLSDTLSCTWCTIFLFLPHFDVICDLFTEQTHDKMESLTQLVSGIIFDFFFAYRMIMLHYVNEMSEEDRHGLVAVMAVSVPWNCMESCYSLEEPINCFLFNKHLTRNLVNMLYR